MILAFTVPSIFFGYLGGVYVDQLSLKKVLVITNLIRAAIILLLSIFISHSIVLFILVFLLAFATVFFIPAEGSAIPALVEEDLLLSANSLFSLTLQTSLIIGFLLGGIALNLVGEKTTIFAIFILFIISLVLNLSLPKNIRAPKAEREGGFFSNFLKGLVVVFKNKHARDAARY
jgi:predicted MFS family arabinose efflux permease